MNSNDITSKIEVMTVTGDHTYIEGTVVVVKTNEGFSVLDNGEETEITTAEEAAVIAAEFVEANRKRNEEGK